MLIGGADLEEGSSDQTDSDVFYGLLSFFFLLSTSSFSFFLFHICKTSPLLQMKNLLLCLRFENGKK